MIFRIATLSAIKHYKRSLVVIGAAAVACAVMVAIGSLLNGITASFYDAVVPAAGHVRIDDADAPKALSPLSLSIFIQDADGAIAAIRGLKDPRIASAESVISFGALLVEDSPNGDPRSLAMRGMGLAPGTLFADNVREALVGGAFLPGGRGICISEAASSLVGAKLGSSVLVLVQDKNGQPWYESLPVTGIFKTESRDFDETTFYISEAGRRRCSIPRAPRGRSGSS
jgi:ABC-type lipoprotein release transport system permease subunit